MPSSTRKSGIEKQRFLIGDGPFHFDCHGKIDCFTRCCHHADMYLYPYDIIRLKQNLAVTSDVFLTDYTITAFRENPNFPHVMLKMSDRPGHPCFFLSEKGCTVYQDRPYSCRAYPLEPAMYGDKNQHAVYCYMVRHPYCLGHRENREWTVKEWFEDQKLDEFNRINAEWAPVQALFHNRSFGERPVDNPAVKMAYMAAYNIDTFRRFVFDTSFLSRFSLSQQRLQSIKESDTDLLLLGFDWIRRLITGKGPLPENHL